MPHATEDDLEAMLRERLATFTDPPWVTYGIVQTWVRKARWHAKCEGQDCGQTITVTCPVDETMPALIGWFRVGHALHTPHTHGQADESDWNMVCDCCGRRTAWDWAIGRPAPGPDLCADCPGGTTPARQRRIDADKRAARRARIGLP